MSQSSKPDQTISNLPAQHSTAQTHRRILADNLQSLSDAFEAGTSINDIVQARAKAVDITLIDIWEQYFADYAEDVALIAVGGYGRAELHPKSDVDMMILLAEGALKKHQSRIEAFITLLWDLKLEIGHSVRTCEECTSEAGKDVTVVTNLMESRLLAGSQQLFKNMRKATAASSIWSKRDFLQAKLEEQTNRHRKFDETAYRLEPNIKEGPGGLRDIQTIFWVAKRYFDAEGLEDLTRLGFLTESELKALLQGREYLWRIRFALHILTGRREDRLLFDHQRELAKMLGFQDDENNLAVEQFMQHYYRTVTELQRLSEMLLQLLQEAIEHRDDTFKPEPINKRFMSVHGYLQVCDEQIFLRYPPALLEVFLIMQQHPELKGVRAQTIRLIRNHLHLIDQKFRDDLICRDLFMQILRQKFGISHELRRMNRYGVLAAYIPEFSNIVGRMQYDLFHVYTVDLHTLFVLRNVRRFSAKEHEHWQPLCSKIFTTLDKPEILYTAALFHDIAKGRGGDHSQLGAVDAEKFCLNHGFDRDSTNTVKWLIQNHLLMSMTAQRKDISDPAVINEFADKVGDQVTLNFLYLLTVADISATNPELLSSWRSGLLQELYLRTKYVFRHGLAKPIDADTHILERQTDAEKMLLERGISAEDVQRVWINFSRDYFLRHIATEIAWHTKAITRANNDDLPLVLIGEPGNRGVTPIFIYARDNDGFFAITTTVMTRLRLNIVDAHIITSTNGFALDTYLVLDEQNQPLLDQYRIDKLRDMLNKNLRQPDNIPRPPPRPVPRRLRHFDVRTRITAEDSADGRLTLVEVIAGDRPGLLATIARAFLDCGVRVHDAKISTIGETAENIFMLSDMHNKPIKNPEALQILTRVVQERIDQQPSADIVDEYTF
ncbi:MAG: [protein-PII] uridylyltransferase [Gammaproteobacteria bacterium]|nr:[protein-PII] uridylyltransferase [Gammaproteobacteria bacterium]